jgi:hypothetical protein
MTLISRTSPRNPAGGPQIALVGDDMYSVMTETDTLGFVYKVGNVFVALSGRDFAHAVEVGQTLEWDRAIQLVRLG